MPLHSIRPGAGRYRCASLSVFIQRSLFGPVDVVPAGPPNGKECTCCRLVLPRVAFNACSGKPDGLQAYCRRCQSIHSYGDRRSPRVQQRRRELWRRPRPHEDRTQRLARERAHRLVAAAVDSRELARPPECEQCGDSAATQAHHEDYGRPLEVVWLCPSCHAHRHPESRRTTARRRRWAIPMFPSMRAALAGRYR
jgi:hypothetical protein